MRAKMEIVSLALPAQRVLPLGSQSTGTIGHQFDLRPTVKVAKRTLGGMSGEGIDCPQLEWNETIDWYEPATNGPIVGGHRAIPAQWRYVGQLRKNMYAENPTSNTFQAWHSYKFFWACNPPNTPSPELKAMLREPDADKAAKHWISKHGFQWEIPELTDRPAMGLAGGSGGGGGASLVTSNSRRRVIYFDLGFTGHPTRIKFVQILESVNGQATIHKFIASDVNRTFVDNAQNLQRWRSQVGQPNNVQP